MMSIKTRKFFLRLILAGAFYSPLANAVCDSRLRLYTEIGCQPVYGNNNSNDCPVAYNCENVFSRPNNKCYSKGNVYEPGTHLNKSGTFNDCMLSCYCDTRSYNNITLTKFHCVDAECPIDRRSDLPPSIVDCYDRYDKEDLCCATDLYCPEEKAIVHECTYNGNIFKKGQRFYMEDFTECVCSESFNGTFNDESCRKLGCNIELRYLDRILNWNAPIFHEKADGCPVEWFYYVSNIATPYATSATSETVSGGPVCRYGNLRFPLGQNVTIGSDLFTQLRYKTTCSCSVPPLVTCIRTPQSLVFE